jgi:ABC-type Fe3+/spermidine/putrescine transport system ATPase subunit
MGNPLEMTLPTEQETADTPRAITFSGVSKRYGAHTAVEPLDLEIFDGEFFCLLGPSGCGKTTTLNLIGGFAAPTTGEIRIAGELVNTTPPHRRKVNTVFQSYALFPHLNVRENVGFGLKMERVRRAEVDTRVGEALHLVALEPYAERYPGQLSGGQQQRVAVARALVNRPAVLLLDEPLGSLDLKLRKHLQVELSQIQRDVGTTFVFVTHDQGEAMAMADRIAVMNAGRIEQLGTPREIYHHPASRFVADFIGESNFIPVAGQSDGVVSTRQRVQLPCPEILRSGSGSLMVRPESVRLTPAAQGDNDSRLVGRVMKSAFLGTFTRVSIDCEVTEEPFLVELPSAKVEGITDDMLVQLSWDADDAVLFHDVDNHDEGRD